MSNFPVNKFKLFRELVVIFYFINLTFFKKITIFLQIKIKKVLSFYKRSVS